MSESMAFIGGVAVAGLAALVLLKGTNTPISSNFAPSPQIPVTFVQPQVMQYPTNYGQPVYTNQPPTAPNSDQRLEKINTQITDLKAENQQLKLQNQQFQAQFQGLTTQQQWQAQLASQQQKVAAPLPVSEPDWKSSPMLWAVGGAVLTIGGGVVAAGVLSLFAPKQRATRTVQVIHPYSRNTQSLNSVRRAEFLPSSRTEPRRVETAEYEEMH